MNTQASADHRPASTAHYGGAIHAGTLLLVEDSRLASDVVRLMFRGAGARLRRTETVAGAVRHLDLYTPDAAMIDLGLPDGSGLDLIATVAQRRPRVPLIIAVSGQTDLAEQALRAGADVFLPKPIESVAVFRQVLSKVFFPFRVTATEPAQTEPNDAALRDDLYLALDMMNGTSAQSPYAAHFISQLACMTGDCDLERAALTGTRAQIATLLRARLRALPLIYWSKENPSG